MTSKYHQNRCNIYRYFVSHVEHTVDNMWMPNVDLASQFINVCMRCCCCWCFFSSFLFVCFFFSVFSLILFNGNSFSSANSTSNYWRLILNLDQIPSNHFQKWHPIWIKGKQKEKIYSIDTFSISKHVYKWIQAIVSVAAATVNMNHSIICNENTVGRWPVCVCVSFNCIPISIGQTK